MEQYRDFIISRSLLLNALFVVDDVALLFDDNGLSIRQSLNEDHLSNVEGEFVKPSEGTRAKAATGGVAVRAWRYVRSDWPACGQLQGQSE